MPSTRIEKDLNDGMYFLTLTVHRWYYVFDRYGRWEILADSLEYCIKHKSLKLCSFVFMLNHIHLIVQSNNVAGFVRDFKRYTSKEIKKNIYRNEPGLLKLFVDKEGRYMFWRKTNSPKLIATENFFLQKVNYIHNNPVVKKYVNTPEDWYWSSANSSCELKSNMNIYY